MNIPDQKTANLKKEKDKLILDFLKRLRIAFSNAAIYSAGHHIPQKSFEEMKECFDRALGAHEAIDIFIAPRYLVIKGEKWEGESLYEDIAKFFHQRCLKSIKIQRGVSVEEINFFLTKASGRPRDILKEGGLPHILRTKNLTRISIEPLDYSEILKSGKEDKDIWAYLLRDAVEQKNLSQIDSLVDYFDQMIHEVGIHDLLTHQEFQESVRGFLAYLKGAKEYALRQCGKIMIENLVKKADIVKDVSIPQDMTSAIESLSHEQIAEVLIQEFFKEPKPLTAVEYYADLFDTDRHKGIIDALVEKLQHQTLAQVNREGLQGFQKLLTESKHPIIARDYRPAISAVLQEITPQNDFSFDKDSLSQHYLQALQFLLVASELQEDLDLVQKKMIVEFDKIEPAQRLDALKSTHLLLSSLISTSSIYYERFNLLFNYIGGLVEEKILTQDASDALVAYISMLKKSTKDPQRYIDAIFNKNVLNPQILVTYFKFFPEGEKDFYQGLRKKLRDTTFLLKFITHLKPLEFSCQIGILKTIYFSPNPYIKVETLNIMKSLDVVDKEFLMGILVDRASGNPQLKEIALQMLMKQEEFHKDVFDAILTIEGVGKKNLSQLEDNIRLVRKSNLRQAKGHLVALSENLSLWQRGLRRLVAETLKGWGHG